MKDLTELERIVCLGKVVNQRHYSFHESACGIDIANHWMFEVNSTVRFHDGISLVGHRKNVAFVVRAEAVRARGKR
jgi:hypothetical protein